MRETKIGAQDLTARFPPGARRIDNRDAEIHFKDGESARMIPGKAGNFQ